MQKICRNIFKDCGRVKFCSVAVNVTTKRLVRVNADVNPEKLGFLEKVIDGNFDLYIDIISNQECDSLMREVDKSFRRTKYEYDHWDGVSGTYIWKTENNRLTVCITEKLDVISVYMIGYIKGVVFLEWFPANKFSHELNGEVQSQEAIVGYRETEKTIWSEENQHILKKIKDVGFESTDSVLDATHILDLADDGYINPHVDSIKFCGSTIVGLSLLSSSIMRYKCCEDSEISFDILLPPLSLYVMRDSLRYDFTHEILPMKESYWNGKLIQRGRRVSLLKRCI